MSNHIKGMQNARCEAVKATQLNWAITYMYIIIESGYVPLTPPSSSHQLQPYLCRVWLPWSSSGWGCSVALKHSTVREALRPDHSPAARWEWAGPTCWRQWLSGMVAGFYVYVKVWTSITQSPFNTRQVGKWSWYSTVRILMQPYIMHVLKHSRTTV